MFTKQALGAFLAGGVLVCGITLAGVAHGASTNAGTTTAGQSDAQYTAKHAWAEDFSLTPQQTATLQIPVGQRLTITTMDTSCAINATVSGNTVSYGYGTPVNQASTTQPIYADSGSTITGAGGTCTAYLVGYLTPIPAG